MCKLKSAIILKDRIFIPDYDSHSQMLEELNIADTRKNAERLFVRAELSPINGDVFTPVDEWKFKVDQDIRPDWFVESYEETRMRDAVKEWAKEHIHIGVNGLKISSGGNHYIKDCKDVEIYGSATVNNICGSATVENIFGSATVNNIYGSATVNYIYDSATVNNIYGSATVNYICDSATVKYIFGSATVNYICGSATVNNIFGSATVENIYGSATVENIYGSATVIGSPYGWNNKDKFIISENATFKDNQAKIIYQAGDWEVRLVDKEKNNE